MIDGETVRRETFYILRRKIEGEIFNYYVFVLYQVVYYDNALNKLNKVRLKIHRECASVEMWYVRIDT